MKLRSLLGLCVVAALAVLAPTAAADPFAGPPICSSPGTAVSGSHTGLTIAGNAYVPAGTTLSVRGNLTLAPGACLDAFTLGTVHVSANVLVGRGSTLALGCTPGSIGPVAPCGTTTTNDTVGGSVLANRAYTMYLDGDTVRGSVLSTGGGPGPTLSPYVNFPIKDNAIYGSLSVRGWQGAWFGALRNTVHGSVSVTDNVGLAIGDFGTLDSTEIATNTIFGSLSCSGNSPAAQLGDSGGTPNNVRGQKLGECAGL